MLKKVQDFDKMKNAIYGFIIGDIVGVPYEFKMRKTFTCTDMRASTFYDSHSTLPLGSWSDDTSLMLAVLDALSLNDACKKEIYDRFRKNAIDWMYNGKFMNHGDDIPYDIGNSCAAGIISMKLGKKNPKADTSVSNGGLMRILPLAFFDYDNDEEILDWIKLFNKDSHNSQISHISCLIYVKIAQNMHKNGENIQKILENIVKNTKDMYKIPELSRIWDLSVLNADESTIKSTGYVVDTLESVIYSLANSKSFSEAILKSINLGDDTDTIGALTGGLAGIIYNIPDIWLNNIRKKEMVDKMVNDFEKGAL